MLEIWFCVFLVVISIILVFFNAYKNWPEEINIIPSIILAFSGIYIVLALSQFRVTEIDIYNELEDYKKLSKKIELVKSVEFKNEEDKNLIIPDLQKEVDKWNNKIQENRFKYQSKWCGYRYSKEIADLPKLSIY